MLSTRDPARDLNGTERVVATRAYHGHPDAQPVRAREHDATPATCVRLAGAAQLVTWAHPRGRCCRRATPRAICEETMRLGHSHRETARAGDGDLGKNPSSSFRRGDSDSEAA